MGPSGGQTGVARPLAARCSTIGGGRSDFGDLVTGGERPSATYAAGAGGNAALMALTRAMGAVSSRYGVRILGINPGSIETDRLVTMLSQRARERFGDPARWRELLDPNYPPGTPAQIADATAFLASDLSANTTGTILTIDGGHCAR